MQELEKQRKAFKRLLTILIILLVLSIGLALAILFYIKIPFQKTVALPVYGNVPEFSLVDQRGNVFTRENLAGKIWVADFIFTNCGGTCPIMSAKMAQLQKALPTSWNVKLVSISVDPERDTPEVLSQYAKNYGADQNRWFFLTGPKKEIVRLAQIGFHLSAGVTPNDTVSKDEIPHSIKFVLVDQRGQIRGYYDGTDQELLESIIHDIKKLRKNGTT